MTESYTTELPTDYHRLVRIDSLDALFKEAKRVDETNADVNVIVWRRGQLAGDFNGLAKVMMTAQPSHSPGIAFIRPHTINHSWLESKKDHPEWTTGVDQAVASLQADFIAFEERSQVPSEIYSNLFIMGGKKYCSSLVHEFHADKNFEWRLLCNYTSPATQWIKNEDAVFSFSTHTAAGTAPIYNATSEATVYSFEAFDIWLHRTIKKTPNPENTKHLDKEKNAFIHRAPPPQPGDHRIIYSGDRTYL